MTYDDADWKLSQVYDVAQLNKKYMANLIHQKNIKLKQYQSCHEYWLLIIIDFWDPAQDQNLLNFINSCDYLVQNNDFKRIYVCKYPTKEFIQLIN